ncbi:hypothetical protein KL86DYS1_30887 [uncultured Dysgonomonas sp.]|uniref:Uncharacterized protein n=1 Tax=uncultured Dysgonomonas sp. TaxID=206096 RepID=A0A212JYM6_9BACT|nr:hypothetical protein KL86DYS1_30887 [uncultured Dysgonomonas sp.]
MHLFLSIGWVLTKSKIMAGMNSIMFLSLFYLALFFLMAFKNF